MDKNLPDTEKKKKSIENVERRSNRENKNEKRNAKESLSLNPGIPWG